MGKQIDFNHSINNEIRDNKLINLTNAKKIKTKDAFSRL